MGILPQISIDIVSSIVGAVIISILIKLWNYFAVIRVFRAINVLITGKKYVLIWIDERVETGKIMEDYFYDKDDRFHYRELNEATKILRYPRGSRFTEVIILINTDVTKFSSNDKIREKVQDYLCKFTNNGGLLVGTHDIIYRRVRNTLLEGLFGCTITEFVKSEEQMDYVINSVYLLHPLLRDLESPIRMEDGEICWGKWHNDAHVLANCTISEKEYPVIVAKKTKLGGIVWINTGDKQKNHCKTILDAITKENVNFLLIILNAIKHKKEILQYSYINNTK